MIVLAGTTLATAGPADREPAPIRLTGCATDPPVDRVGVLFPRGPDEAYHEPVEVVGGAITWMHVGARPRRAGPGQGTLAIDGFAPADIDWTDAALGFAHCAPKVVVLHPEDLVVTGTVGSPYPEDTPLVVVGCGGFARVAPDWTFRIAIADAPGCRLSAMPDAGVHSSGLPIGAPVDATDATVPIHLSAAPAGYALHGLVVAQTDRGVRIVAAEHGPLEVGDVLVTADGERLGGRADGVGLAAEVLSAFDTTTHVLEVRRGRERRELTVRWAFAEPGSTSIRADWDLR